MKIITKSEFKRTPWKNGQGSTDEIAIYPRDSDLELGNFIWRLSQAKIEQASPFSFFPKHNRVLVVLGEKGLRLFHRFENQSGETAIILQPFRAHEFPGDIASRCELISGPVQDFSVFVSKERASAQVTPLELLEDTLFEWSPRGRYNFALAANSEFSARQNSNEASFISRGDCLSLDVGDEKSIIELQTKERNARVILVEISLLC